MKAPGRSTGSLALALILTALLAAGCGGEDPTTRSTPTTALPDPSEHDAAKTVAYMDSKGAPILDMHSMGVNLAEAADMEACADAIDTLNAGASPSDALEISTAIPDDPLREAFLSERVAIAKTVANCDSSKLTANLDQLTDVTALVDQRLAELGVEQP